MSSHTGLVAAVSDATSPISALTAATQVVAEAVEADTCAIFVRRDKNRLELRAYHNLLSAVPNTDPERQLAATTLDAVLPQVGQGEMRGTVAVPVVSIDQVIGTVVVRRPAGFPFTAEEIMRLSGFATELVEVIKGVGLQDCLLPERRPNDIPNDSSVSPSDTKELTVVGIAVSSGIAIGEVAFRKGFPRALIRRNVRGCNSVVEAAQIRDAFEKAKNDLLRLRAVAAAEIGEDNALIFGAHLLLLNDTLLADLIREGIAAGHSASIAVDLAFTEVVGRVQAAHDPYIRERVEDLEDLRSRLLDYLIGDERREGIDDRVIVSTRTAPSLVIELNARGGLGIASQYGGPTSHSALLARAFGIPSVTGLSGLMHKVFPGNVLIIDGEHGLVIVRPTNQTRTEYERRQQVMKRQRTEFLRYRDRPAITADGVRLKLQATVALGTDIDAARENKAEGIGLYRTEFPFIVRDAVPSIVEQVKIYERAYRAFPTAPVTFRLLDLAGDKFLPRAELRLPPEVFYGYRSLRILFDYPHLLRDQAQAIAIAAAGREVRLLIPMVTSLEDVLRIKKMVEAAMAESHDFSADILITYGAMVETPAAVEIVKDLAHEIDFYSIGTNDLVQYTLVMDREDPRVNLERQAYHPAMLRMIRRTIEAAHAMGKPVSVCGELAARLEFAIALLAMGIDSLSIMPRVIPEFKQAISRVAVGPLRARLGELLALGTADAVESYLHRYVQVK